MWYFQSDEEVCARSKHIFYFYLILYYGLLSIFWRNELHGNVNNDGSDLLLSTIEN